MTKVNDINGNAIDFEAALSIMDDEIAESIHGTVENDQEFIEKYAEAHMEKFGEEFAPYYGHAW